MSFFSSFFNAGPFMPHGHCYFWTPSLIALQVVSDALIVLAYYSIPITLVYFVRKRKDLKFHWMFVCFAVFILACGTTHLLEIWNVWHGHYWLSGAVKAMTAMASVPTAILLVKLVPQALALPSPDALQKAYDQLEQRVAERTLQLKITNANLVQEAQERQRAEQEIRQLNDTLEQRVAERSAQLEVANRELEAFSYSISHDLRAPLRAVNGFAGIVLDEYGAYLPEQGRGYLERVRTGSHQMGELIDDLLEFSRLSREPVSRRTVDTNRLVQEALDELKPEREGRQIEIRVGELPECDADPALAKQVWVNLLSNAIKYTRDRSPAIVEVGCERTTASANAYFIRDNGVGFDMKYSDKLFGVFQRLHRAEDFEGTGVGLAIVQRIVHRHGGRVWVEGQVNSGATFHFTLEPEKNHKEGQVFP